MNLNLIILGFTGLIIFILVLGLVLGIKKFNDEINYRKLKNIKELDVIEDEESILHFENEEDREIINRYISKTYKGLEDIYNNNTWENKRFLYKIMLSISELKDNVEFNKLTETDIEKINSLICVYRLDKDLDKNLESIIFEWENNYVV